MLLLNKIRSDRAILITDSSKKAIVECPTCLLAVRDSEDVNSIKEFGGCTECIINFMHSHEIDWEMGERPKFQTARKKIVNIFNLRGNYEKK